MCGGYQRLLTIKSIVVVFIVIVGGFPLKWVPLSFGEESTLVETKPNDQYE